MKRVWIKRRHKDLGTHVRLSSYNEALKSQVIELGGERFAAIFTDDPRTMKVARKRKWEDVTEQYYAEQEAAEPEPAPAPKPAPKPRRRRTRKSE